MHSSAREINNNEKELLTTNKENYNFHMNKGEKYTHSEMKATDEKFLAALAETLNA